MVLQRMSSSAIRVVRRSAVWRDKSKLGLLTLLLVTYHNKRMETKRSYYKSFLHLIHALLFLARKSVTVILRRIAGFSQHPYWHPVEEIFVKTIAFSARIGHVTAPRLAIDGYEALQRLSARIVRHCYLEDVDLGLGRGTGDGLWITLEPNTKLGSIPTILYYHGGGYCIGSAGMYINAHAKWLKYLKEHHGMIVGILSVDYPLAPETKFPENINFSCRAFDALVDRFSVCPSNVIIAGDSAGGAIAFQVSRHASEKSEREQTKSTAGLVLISPWVDHSLDAASHDDNLETDFIAGRDIIGDYSAAYCENHDPTEHPAISPIHESFEFLPPLFTTVGMREVFHNDIELFVKKVQESGKKVATHVGDDCPHIYPLLWPLFNSNSSRALQDMAAFCAKQFNACSMH